MQTVLTMVWDKLLPAFRRRALPGDEEDERLQDALDGLSLPAVLVGLAPGSGTGWAGTTFVPTGGSCQEQPSLAAVRVNLGKDGWSVALCEDVGEVEAPLAGGRWAVGEQVLSGGDEMPVASSGAWQSPAVLRVDLIFLETPHRLSVTCNLDDKTFRASWASRPGHASRLATCVHRPPQGPDAVIICSAIPH